MSRVLIVDDDPSVTETFGRILRLRGYEVLIALNGETALHELENFRPDAVLLDLRMPLVNGLTFLRRLRALEHHGRTPVAIITGDYLVDHASATEIRELDAAVHFKPLRLTDLVRITQGLLQRTPDRPDAPS
jgi:two-component system, OmpR family, response regulator MprA